MNTETGAPKLAGMNYQVEAIVHSTGPSTVMLVSDPKSLSKRYVVKVIKRDDPKADGLLARAQAAVEASARLNHPGALRYHDYRPVKHFFKLVRGELLMEYVEGKPLDQLPGLAVGPAILITRQIAHALAHMHRRKVLHGDLQPGHVLLSRTGQVKLLNYGLPGVAPDLRPAPARAYAAPEVVRENRFLEASDVYSLGAILYQILTGKPFASPKTKSGEDEALKMPNPAALNPKIPPTLGNLVVSCLHRHAPRRPPSPYDVLQQLEPLVEQLQLDDEQLAGLAAADPR
ncbi:MAG: hypothetical protein KatS3mg108_3688 [Isosphaeraceae bacterium]|nr:MAG: hypothetical protein KatS3mg108_3688 [Isosphaeraceae bacterium]